MERLDGGADTKVQKEEIKQLFIVTAYCPCVQCCGKNDGITSTGSKATEGRTVAVDPNQIPYGSEINIEGVGIRTAEDCGGAIQGNRIDLFFDTHQEALNFGRQTKQVTILS